jgi:SAM-dependent methyltransferase
MPERPEIDWYDTPRYYDLVFDEDTPLEGHFLEAMVERHGRSRGRRALEPACGSGRLVVELARRGWRVTGNDLSRPMLAYAHARLREEGLAARLVHGDMAELELTGRFDLGHCLVSTFKYLLSERAATRHLERVADLLVPGGLYCLGFHLTDYDNLRFDRERWVVDEGDTRVVCNIQAWPADPGRRRERMRSRMRITEAGRVHEQETHWWFRTWDARQVRRLLRREPRLELVAVHDFRYDPEAEIELEEGFDVLLVLRRRPD